MEALNCMALGTEIGDVKAIGKHLVIFFLEMKCTHISRTVTAFLVESRHWAAQMRNRVATWIFTP
jgi:hypothetical protein